MSQLNTMIAVNVTECNDGCEVQRWLRYATMVAKCNYGGKVQRWRRSATMEAECYVECGRPGRTLKSVQIVNYHINKNKN